MTEETFGHHWCGGIIHAARLTWNIDGHAFEFDGHKCDRCQVESIPGNELERLEAEIPWGKEG